MDKIALYSAFNLIKKKKKVFYTTSKLISLFIST